MGINIGISQNMEHLEHPTRVVWEVRRAWFESIEQRARGDANYFVSEQACALTAEVQACFCTGAWVAVVVISMAVVDAALRETEVPGFRGNTKKLIDNAEANAELHRLRERRNKLVHVNPDTPALTVDQQWTDRIALEADARRAVELMFDAFYMGPWT